MPLMGRGSGEPSLLGGDFLVGIVQALLEFGHVSIPDYYEALAGQKEVCPGFWTLLIW